MQVVQCYYCNSTTFEIEVPQFNLYCVQCRKKQPYEGQAETKVKDVESYVV